VPNSFVGSAKHAPGWNMLFRVFPHSLSLHSVHTHSLSLSGERERERECAPTTVKHCQKFHSVFGVHLKKVRFSQIHPREGSYFVFKKEHFAQKQNVHPYKLIV